MPTVITFEDTDALGIEVIDAQHRRFFDLLAGFAEAIEVGGDDEAVHQALEAMVDYVNDHFATEERYMRDFGYPDYDAHRRLHTGFVRKIISVNQALRDGHSEIDADLIAYLGCWFREHIRREDPKYAELFKARGL